MQIMEVVIIKQFFLLRAELSSELSTVSVDIKF
jgi:hypothetical protein